jgi:ribose 5-phosphate isomerase B
MRVGIAADRGGFRLKANVAESLRSSGNEMVDFGAHQLNAGDRETESWTRKSKRL